MIYSENSGEMVLYFISFCHDKKILSPKDLLALDLTLFLALSSKMFHESLELFCSFLNKIKLGLTM